jgi:hypothetical protein
MTTRHHRDLRRYLITLAEPYGAKLIAIKHTGSGHLCATIAYGTRTFNIYASLTPKSDWRADRENASLVKRKLRELTTGRQS